MSTTRQSGRTAPEASTGCCRSEESLASAAPRSTGRSGHGPRPAESDVSRWHGNSMPPGVQSVYTRGLPSSTGQGCPWVGLPSASARRCIVSTAHGAAVSPGTVGTRGDTGATTNCARPWTTGGLGGAAGAAGAATACTRREVRVDICPSWSGLAVHLVYLRAGDLDRVLGVRAHLPGHLPGRLLRVEHHKTVA